MKNKHTRNIRSTVIDWSKRSQPAYLFKAAMEAPEQWVQSFQTYKNVNLVGAFIAIFEQIPNMIPLLPLFTLNKYP